MIKLTGCTQSTLFAYNLLDAGQPLHTIARIPRSHPLYPFHLFPINANETDLRFGEFTFGITPPLDRINTPLAFFNDIGLEPSFCSVYGCSLYISRKLIS